MAAAVLAGVAFHGVFVLRKLIRQRPNHPRDENGDRDAAPRRQRRLLPSPRFTRSHPSLTRPDGPLPQTAISPNECYHSMTHPSGRPTLAFTIDSAPRCRRRKTPPRPGCSSGCEVPAGGCVASRSAAETVGAVYTCVLCRAVRRISHGPDYSRRASTLKRLN